jgi:hypothetical protein
MKSRIGINMDNPKAMAMLTEYFKMNDVDPYARNFLYKEFPEFYWWIKGTKKWQRRKLKGRGRLEELFMHILLKVRDTS